MLFYYCSAVLSVIYASKYIFLWFAGWVFNVKEAADTYTFVVFLINKILGVIIMPFIVIIAFSNSEVVTVSLTISVLLITILFLYRYIVSYAPVRKAMKVSPLHFFFYISAFELIPLLLIYKVLMLYLNRSL